MRLIVVQSWMRSICRDGDSLRHVSVQRLPLYTRSQRNAKNTQRRRQRRSHGLKSPDLSHRDHKLSTSLISSSLGGQAHRKVDALRTSELDRRSTHHNDIIPRSCGHDDVGLDPWMRPLSVCSPIVYRPVRALQLCPIFWYIQSFDRRHIECVARESRPSERQLRC